MTGTTNVVKDAPPQRWPAVVTLGLVLLPALAAVWWVPWFITQDGPAHLYNAEVIADSLSGRSTFAGYYQVRWELLPNWAGHLLAAAGLLTGLPARVVDRALMTLTLAGFATSILWLRGRVAGTEGAKLAALIAALVALNVTWLLGFTSFLIGACLYPITLGVWWTGRHDLRWGRVAVLAGLLAVGYFCHLVSLGLTVGGLGVLALLTPGSNWRQRLARTLVALLAVVPLALIYLQKSQRGGSLNPVWAHGFKPFTPSWWTRQLGWVDPISLASKLHVPFVESTPSRWCALATPVLWFAAGLVLLAFCSGRECGNLREHRGWWALGAGLLFSALAAPDHFGAGHGEYLHQRVVLFGLVSLIPVLDLRNLDRSEGSQDTAQRTQGVRPGWTVLRRAATGALAIAWLMQSALVWDYALASDRAVRTLMEARDAIGTNQRVATLLGNIRSPFRANAVLHADCLLGLGTGNIIWANYETRYYYFPVQFVPTLDRPDSWELEQIAMTGGPDNRVARAARWETFLAAHCRSIDRLLVWETPRDPQIDAINARWFEPVFDGDQVRVLKPLSRSLAIAPARHEAVR